MRFIWTRSELKKKKIQPPLKRYIYSNCRSEVIREFRWKFSLWTMLFLEDYIPAKVFPLKNCVKVPAKILHLRLNCWEKACLCSQKVTMNTEKVHMNLKSAGEHFKKKWPWTRKSWNVLAFFGKKVPMNREICSLTD